MLLTWSEGTYIALDGDLRLLFVFLLILLLVYTGSIKSVLLDTGLTTEISGILTGASVYILFCIGTKLNELFNIKLELLTSVLSILMLLDVLFVLCILAQLDILVELDILVKLAVELSDNKEAS